MEHLVAATSVPGLCPAGDPCWMSYPLYSLIFPVCLFTYLLSNKDKNTFKMYFSFVYQQSLDVSLPLFVQ